MYVILCIHHSTSFYIHTSFYAFYACHVECNEVNYIQYLYFPPPPYCNKERVACLRPSSKFTADQLPYQWG